MLVAISRRVAPLLPIGPRGPSGDMMRLGANRVDFLGVDSQLLDRGRDGALGQFAELGQSIQRGDGDALGVDLEVAPERLAKLATAESIGA